MIDLIRRFTNGNIDKNLGSPSERQFLPFKLPIDKAIVIEGTFTDMCITLSKMKPSLCAIDNTEASYK